MDKLLQIIKGTEKERWYERNLEAKQELFGAKTGRFPQSAENSIGFRAPESIDVPYAAYIHSENATSGMYGGMSFVIFPVEGKPCLISMVVGTLGLNPDEDILGRPGHARKVQAICAWLNLKYGKGQMLAWAKQDPTRIDIDVPDNVKKAFPEYKSVFDRYGKVLYGFFVPTDNENAIEEALKAFLDLMFEERGYGNLSSSVKDAEQIRTEYYSFLTPDVTNEHVCSLLEHRKYVILEGPPGTGKTRMARQILQEKYKSNGFSVQFHPNMTYENFVGGLAPVQTGTGMGFQFAPQPGFLMKVAKMALENPDTPFLLHIDEINRADLSKVLGEAIFLMEPNAGEKRELMLPYDFGSPFYNKFWLPDNLHIIGTMNSADRSIAIVDVAVRRRFAFVKLWPQMRVVKKHSGELMEKAFRTMLDIFVEYASEDAFALMPGHSYFLEDDKKAIQSLKVNLAPLLEEYLAQGYVASFANPIRAYLQWIESLKG